jgi:hypothetical protein
MTYTRELIRLVGTPPYVYELNRITEAAAPVALEAIEEALLSFLAERVKTEAPELKLDDFRTVQAIASLVLRLRATGGYDA